MSMRQGWNQGGGFHQALSIYGQMLLPGRRWNAQVRLVEESTVYVLRL